MKNILLFTAIIALPTLGLSTVWTVVNSGTTFSPDAITITEGDSVQFNITASHNVVEVSQTTYNANGNTPLAGGFQLPFGGGLLLPADLPVGTHYYVCSPHAGFGMKGIITVNPCTAPNQPSVISGPTTICELSANTYSVTSDPNATSYAWSLPGGWTGSSTTNSISTTAGTTGGVISVTASNSCGTSSAQTLTVAVNGTVPATPGTITGDTEVCKNSTNVYSISAVSGADSYSWSLPSGWTGSSTTTSISATSTTTGGTISVSAVNTCGTSSPSTLNVNITSHDLTVSVSDSILTSNDTVSNYQWYDCNLQSILVGETDQSYTAASTGAYAVILDLNGCIDTSNCVQVTIVGLNNLVAEDLLLFPNPASSSFVLKGVYTNTYMVSIYNAQGELIKSITSNEEHLYSIDDLLPGVYILSINSKEGKRNLRLIKN
ncbi:MAG: T9SS type A sorting domain-containing protein [Crocinitomicaceae bacterium]|nr:T9SS type A sorting domain-containing protein [Crocinitomicaceae bacterium]